MSWKSIAAQWRDTYEAFRETYTNTSVRRSARLTRFNELFRAMFIDRHPAYPLEHRPLGSWQGEGKKRDLVARLGIARPIDGHSGERLQVVLDPEAIAEQRPRGLLADVLLHGPRAPLGQPLVHARVADGVGGGQRQRGVVHQAVAVRGRFDAHARHRPKHSPGEQPLIEAHAERRDRGPALVASSGPSREAASGSRRARKARSSSTTAHSTRRCIGWRVVVW